MRDGRGIVRIRRCTDSAKTEPVQASDDAVDVRPEGEAVAEEYPLDADDCDSDEALHQGPQNVFPPDHSAVEQCEPGRHKHNEGGRYEYKSGITRIDFDR